MKPFPVVMHKLLDTLPEETIRVTLNTNRKGHWEIETVARYSFDEEPQAGAYEPGSLMQYYLKRIKDPGPEGFLHDGGP